MTQHPRRRTTREPSACGRTLRQPMAMVIALVSVMMAVPVAAQDTPDTSAIEVHVSECPPGYEGENLFNDCHANGMTGVDVQLSGAVSDTKTTEGSTGAVRFQDIPAGTYTIQLAFPDAGQQYRTYCSLESSDERVEMTPGNANPGSVDLVGGQAIICDFHVIPPVESEPEEQEEAAEPETVELAQVTVNPVVCPEGTDGTDGFDSLSAACTEPADDTEFSWGDANGTLIEVIGTEDGDSANGENGQAIIDEIEPGTYTLYSDVPLEFASEVLFCVADEGNRYQKEFSVNGVTSFTDVKREQIVCDWFIVPYDQEVENEATETAASVSTQAPVVTPTTALDAEGIPTEPPADSEDARGVESGGSLVVHLSLCEPDYDDDTIFDDCHGVGISDQEFVLGGPDGDLRETTVVPQTPGPGIVEFTGLPAGDYTLAGGPPGDFGSVRLYCTTQPDGAFVDTDLDSTRAAFNIGEGEDLLCDWYYIPVNQQGGEAPMPTVAPEPEERAEILVTLYACGPGESLVGASYDDFAAACDDARDGVAFTLGDVDAPPLTANTGASGAGSVRFYELLPADYTLTPSLTAGLASAAVFCRIGDGDIYQKTITNGSTTFVDVNGESITCDWFATNQESDPAPDSRAPGGSITVREFLCEGDQREIEDWEQNCEAGTTGATFTVTSIGGEVALTSPTDASGVAIFTGLPDGFYTLKQNDGVWCKARAERVDSQSRVIVEDGQNTDVFLYQCSQVTDLPNTGTGPGIGLLETSDWWESISTTQLASMGVGVLGVMLLMEWGVIRRLSA